MNIDVEHDCKVLRSIGTASRLPSHGHFRTPNAPDLTSQSILPIVAPMRLSYSIYEAKAKLSEILRVVRKGRRITITDRGREVARIVP
ncbi:MAG TPA: type II toxin-antitoxin system prevent-host-death family antitoxin, partial [Planctomycetota bacterium]|nr:type II toxin-antitoxin system prevent-host-death family antitoxin [Planctomycetota bacterium]